MHIAVYLPLLLPLLTAPGARLLSERCDPRLATWLLTASAVVLAAASTASLALLTLTGLIRLPLLAGLGHWSPTAAERDNPTMPYIGLIAGVLLAAAAVVASRMLWRRARALAGAVLDAACMPTPDGLVVVDDPAPEAFAVPGLPGRVVVSSGMLHALDDCEHDILLAHERAHLVGHHYAFVALAQLGAAANPLLRPLATAVAYTIERWADEDAASTVGDRRHVARTVGKAALATRRTPTRTALPSAGMGILGALGRRTPLASAGPVPRRVAALLTEPVNHRTAPALVTVTVLATAAWCTAEAAHDTHVLLKLAGAW